MRTREEIENDIESREQKIIELKNEIKLFTIEYYKLCDEKQWYTEEIIESIIHKRPKITEKNLFGIIHWIENFQDEDTGELIPIERCRKIMKNGIFY